MRALIQRVGSARVTVDGRETGAIEKGILVFLGVMQGDGPEDLAELVSKTVQLRIFPDENGKMNRSLKDVGGSLLVVSQFTLAGDVHKGTRPSFTAAARPEDARELYTKALELFSDSGVKVASGEFGAMMQVELVNDGPVTLWIDTRAKS